MKKNNIIAFFLALASTNAFSAVYSEVGDAGQLLPVAQNVGENINSINGNLDSSINDIVDLYRLTFNHTGVVSFSLTHSGSDWFDEDMFVFNSSGNPLLISDNQNFSLNVNPGTYYIAIADWNIAAIGTQGEPIADDYYNVFKSNGVLSGWAVNSSPVRYGSYTLNFDSSTSVVPIPGAGFLFLGSIFVLAGITKKKS